MAINGAVVAEPLESAIAKVGQKLATNPSCRSFVLVPMFIPGRRLWQVASQDKDGPFNKPATGRLGQITAAVVAAALLSSPQPA